MTDKSSIKTSRKIYAMRASFGMLVFIGVLYALLAFFGKGPSEVVFGALIAAVGSIVSCLQIADGMKGHEPK